MIIDRYVQVNMTHNVLQLLGVNVTSSVRTDYVISADNVIQTATTQESWTARVNMDRSLTTVVQVRYDLSVKVSTDHNFLLINCTWPEGQFCIT